MVADDQGRQRQGRLAGAVINSFATHQSSVTMVAAMPRLLPGRNTWRTFDHDPGKLLRAPLFSHTPP
jgi:hypothetical protein